VNFSVEETVYGKDRKENAKSPEKATTGAMGGSRFAPLRSLCKTVVRVSGQKQ
jgi:hypothetical protein